MEAAGQIASIVLLLAIEARHQARQLVAHGQSAVPRAGGGARSWSEVEELYHAVLW
jgi:hypothetical protein